MSSVPRHPRQPLPTTPPAEVSFHGDRGSFFGLVTRGAGLELITFGFYRFWLATDIRRHLWSYSSVDGDAPEYTGRGRELLVGFLFALAILVPIYVAYFLIGIEAERAKAFLSLPLFLFFYLFGQFAIYRARRYRLTRTVWRGVRFWMDGSGWSYAFRAFGWGLLVGLTLGLLMPWREAALERYKMRHCYYGDLQGSFEGTGWGLFKRGWFLWLIGLFSFFVLVGVSAGRAANPTRGAGPEMLLGVLTLVWMIAFPFVYGAFKAIEWRWWLSGIRFGEVSCESDLPASALMGVYWKVVGWFVLILLLFGVYVAGCLKVLVGFDDMTHLAQRIQGNLGFTVALVAGYLGFILTMNIVMRLYLLRDVWAKVVSSVTIYRLDAAANVAATGEMANALGEGFANGLDVVGF